MEVNVSLNAGTHMALIETSVFVGDIRQIRICYDCAFKGSYRLSVSNIVSVPNVSTLAISFLSIFTSAVSVIRATELNDNRTFNLDTEAEKKLKSQNHPRVDFM